MARAIAGAIADAGIGPESVGYYNAHGTGTEANDRSEWRAVRRVFGDAPPPLSASKSFLGHTFGAAGTLEAIVCILALEDGAVPPTLGFTGPRDEGPIDPVAAPVPRPHAFDVAVSLNAAFGGANAAVAIGRAPREAMLRRREVFVLGEGLVVPDRPLGELPLSELPRVDPRELDRSGALLTVAVGRALKAAGRRPSGAARDRAGLVVGVAQRPGESSRAYDASIAARGITRASAAAFARTVMNASTGAACRALALRGPGGTLAQGPGAGLFAAAWAIEMLAVRSDADMLVAGAVDEVTSPDVLDAIDAAWGGPSASARPATGAELGVAVAFGAGEGPRVLGVGFGRTLEDALCAASTRSGGADVVFGSVLGQAGEAVERAVVERVLPGVRVMPSPVHALGHAQAAPALVALAWAARHVREKGGKAAAIGGDPRVAGCAIVLG